MTKLVEGPDAQRLCAEGDYAADVAQNGEKVRTPVLCVGGIV